MTNKITPFLWFDNQAEEAARFYTSLFKNSKLISIANAGPVTTVEFEIEGQRIMGMNAGPQFKFNEAISFFVNCEDQTEVDLYWNTILQAGGEESMCGWIKDQFGLWWQIVPKQLGECLANPDPEKSKRAMEEMLKMKKIIVADLQKAVE